MMTKRGRADSRAEAPDVRGGTGAEDVQNLAMHLFAELGYDGVSTQMIEDAAGLDRGTVADEYGGKRGLYVAAIERVTDGWRVQQDLGAASFTPDADGLFAMYDRFLMHCLEHPELPKLWQHRWLSDASDISGLEERTFLPVLAEMHAIVSKAVGPDVDVEMAMWTLGLLVSNYAQAGLPASDGRRYPPDDPDVLRRVRAHIYWLARAMASAGR
jgi:AcrR family transcriptional regulator